jgi:hypothetical protein
VALEVRRPVEAVVQARDRERLVVERGAHLVDAPHVELAFLALAVRVERARNAPSSARISARIHATMPRATLGVARFARPSAASA